MNRDTFNDALWLIDGISLGLQVRGGSAARTVLARLAEQNLSEATFTENAPRNLPVTVFFAEAIAETLMLEPSVAAALAAIDGHLTWSQTSRYTDAMLGEGFLQNYGWCEIIGPKGFFKGEDFLLGLLMLGPKRHYKDHYHPAPELYWPLTGPAEWKQGEGNFVLKQAGDIIWHAPNEIHAIKTSDRPLLAVWSWTRDTDVAARLVEI
jgi:Dimethlysulfonioproprionate lyase